MVEKIVTASRILLRKSSLLERKLLGKALRKILWYSGVCGTARHESRGGNLHCSREAEKEARYREQEGRRPRAL